MCYLLSISHRFHSSIRDAVDFIWKAGLNEKAKFRLLRKSVKERRDRFQWAMFRSLLEQDSLQSISLPSTFTREIFPLVQLLLWFLVA